MEAMKPSFKGSHLEAMINSLVGEMQAKPILFSNMAGVVIRTVYARRLQQCDLVAMSYAHYISAFCCCLSLQRFSSYSTIYIFIYGNVRENVLLGLLNCAALLNMYVVFQGFYFSS